MSLAKTFFLLKDAETRTGELYAMIALSVSVTQPDLADLFNDLAGEEEQHARQVELMRCYFQESPDAFLETPEAERIIAEFMANLDTIKNYFNQHYGSIRPVDLIDLALDVERHLVESHHAFLFNVIDPQLKKLFENLNLGNAAHIRKLENYKPG
jgi:rubrerythrin